MNTKPENYLKEYDSQRNNIDYYLSEHLGMNTLHKEVECERWRVRTSPSCPVEESVMSSGLNQATPNTHKEGGKELTNHQPG